MLSSIRKFSKSFMAKIFIAIIALPFLLWGMGDVFRSGKQNVIVEINKDKISSKEFVNYIQKVQLTNEEIKKFGKSKIFDDVLTNYISEKIISIETEKKGLVLTDKSLREIIFSDKNFQKNEKFSETKYEKFMLETGFTKTNYEKRLRDMELKGQLLTFYSGGIKLPDFIVRDLYTKNNISKEIQYLDLNKIYSNKNISDKEIKEFYEKNKKFFTEKFKNFRYVELVPETLTGKKDFDESYFKKLNEIENNILDGNDFDTIIPGLKGKLKSTGFLNSTKTNENGKEAKELNEDFFKKIFSIQNRKSPEFINFKDKYFMVELLDEKEVETSLADVNLRKTINAQLKFTYILKENKKIQDNIKNRKFGENEMMLLSKENNIQIDKTKIKNINDNSKFNAVLLNGIYKFNKGQIFVLSDSLLKENYLIRISEEESPKININSDEYKENIKKANAEYIKKVYKSYDKHVNSKYNVEVNNKVFERIKNSF